MISPLRNCTILLLFFISLKTEAQVRVSEEKWVLPTYEVAPPDKNPMFFKGETYQGASKMIYPYGMNDVISNDRIERTWKALILENEYIKLCVTPEIGGKLYYATDKTNGYNFIYKNNVVKPSNIGMLGAWVSGGIEWCVLHHHRASTMLPVDYDIAENPDGSKTIWVGETEPRHQMRWTIGITAYPGKSYYSADVKIINQTPLTHTFLYWANVATHTNKDYQVIFPPSVNVATYHAKNSFTNWPYSTEVYTGEDFTRGVDISRWINVENSNSFFAHDLREDFMGGYDHGKQTGTVHIGDHNVVKGAKLWEWGSGPRGQATEGRLTENDGPYVEIMVGAFSDNQPDYSWIRPYEVKTFRQYWYPVKDIQGFRNANLNGALNLEKRADKIWIGFYSTQKVSKAKITLKVKDRVLLEKTLEVSPEKSFTSLLPLKEQFEETDLFASVTNEETGEMLVSYKPVKHEKPAKLPEEVKRPPLPADIATVEELFLTGSRILQFYNPNLDAADYFDEALKRDPGDIRTNTAVGNICLKNGEYEKARKHFATAIRRLTKDYTRPADCEPLYLQGLTLKALGLYDEAIDTLYRATWDHAMHHAAYLELARISAIRGDYEKAYAQVNEALKTNTSNNAAINFKASLLRKTGKNEGALMHALTVMHEDPLDFRAINEAWLVSSDKNILESLEKKMRGFNRNYLELAVSYLNDGLSGEAEDVLKRFTGNDQEITYYLGYIEDLKGNRETASNYFKTASAMPVDYGFPYRLETMNVLKKASEYFPEDSRPYYYMGNLLYDRQPQSAIENWEKAVKYEPALAIAWRNLGWGYYHHAQDLTKSIAAYEKALGTKKDDPVYYAELDPLYEMNNTPIEKRAALFSGVNDIVKQRDDAFVREIMVLNLSGQYDKSVEYLGKSTFHFREGSSRVRDITVDAHLLMGRKYLEEKNFKAALTEFLDLAATPENSDIGRRGDFRTPQINYFTALAYEGLGQKSKARQYFALAANDQSRQASYIDYYKALGCLKTGNKARANDLLNKMISDADTRIKRGEEVDFFAKFGEREAANVQLSNAYLMKGLGYKGLGDNVKAGENLKKAMELSASNLFAKVESESF